MEKDRVVHIVIVHPQTESDIFEWEAVDYLRECLFCDFGGEQVPHGGRKSGLMICIENVTHATCVNVLGGSHRGPPRGVVHVVLGLGRLFVVVLRMRRQINQTCVEREESKMLDLARTQISTYLLGLKYLGRLVSIVAMNGSDL